MSVRKAETLMSFIKTPVLKIVLISWKVTDNKYFHTLEVKEQFIKNKIVQFLYIFTEHKVLQQFIIQHLLRTTLIISVYKFKFMCRN